MSGSNRGLCPLGNCSITEIEFLSSFKHLLKWQSFYLFIDLWCMCICLVVCMYVYMHVCVFVCVCLCIHVCVYLCVWLCKRDSISCSLGIPNIFAPTDELELLSPYLTSARMVALWATAASLQSGMSNTTIFTCCVRAPPTGLQPFSFYVLVIGIYSFFFFPACNQLGYSCHWNYRPVLAPHGDQKLKQLKSLLLTSHIYPLTYYEDFPRALLSRFDSDFPYSGCSGN